MTVFIVFAKRSWGLLELPCMSVLKSIDVTVLISRSLGTVSYFHCLFRLGLGTWCRVSRSCTYCLDPISYCLLCM